MSITLVRHGEKIGKGFIASLTNGGRKQIKILAGKLKNESYDLIFSSSNPRSIESAHIICKKLRRHFIVLYNVKEVDNSLFFGTPRKEDINSIKEVLRIIKEHKDLNLLFVMNAGLNRGIICELLKIPFSSGTYLSQDPASITKLKKIEAYERKFWALRKLNEK